MAIATKSCCPPETAFDYNTNMKTRSSEMNRAPSEVYRFFRSMKTYFTNRELNEVMYIIDVNNDGQVSFQEFIQYILEDV